MSSLEQQGQPSKTDEKLTVKEFQEGIRTGSIEGYRCKDCGHKQIDIIDYCPNCHGSNLEKQSFAGEGKVVTYTIQFVAPEQFINEVPYAWVIVELDDGPKVTGWVPFVSKPSELLIGQRVRFVKSYLPGIVFQKI